MNQSTRSLRHGTDHKTRWYPVRIDAWEAALSQLQFSGNQLVPDDKVRKNLAYNLQYLEYLQQTLAELALSAVLKKQTFKSCIIVAIGILESILFHVVSANGICERNFSRILKRLRQSALLGRSNQIYADLDRFRRLRNKVHIYEIPDAISTDYVSFSEREYNEMRSTLLTVVKNKRLGLSESAADLFSFLRV